MDIDVIMENLDLLLKYVDVKWEKLFTNEKLDEELIRKYYNKIHSSVICKTQILSESFIREYANKISWKSVSQYQKLNESFIREFADKVSWDCISQYQKLSESFIREFADKVNWVDISEKQKLSESFIREFADKVDWEWISMKQKLSENFILEFKHKILFKHFLDNKYSYCYENLIFENNKYLKEYIITKYFSLIIDYDLTYHSPQFIDLLEEIKQITNKLDIDERTLKIKQFQMRTCRWCPLARKWFHRIRFNWDRYWHYIECWRSNPRFSYVRRKLEREWEEYCEGLKTLTNK